MIPYAKQLSKSWGKRNFDAQSWIQRDPHDNNVEREDIERDENRKKLTT